MRPPRDCIPQHLPPKELRVTLQVALIGSDRAAKTAYAKGGI